MGQASAVKDYFRDIQTYFTSGEAREHSYRGPLQNLLHTLVPEIVAINEPKHIECGAPDYVIKQKQFRLGHIEAKDIDKSLDKVESSEQMRRYLEALPNLILTNYVEFRWYVEGKHRATANLAKLSPQRRFVFDKAGGDDVARLLEEFIRARLPKIGSPKELATRMAAIARLVCGAIMKAMQDQNKSLILHDQLKSFRETLLPNLDVDTFADMYAQTICYGMFAAKCNLKSGDIFSRYNAASHIPKTNPFLRSLFDTIAGVHIDDRISWAVDDLVELLNRSDMEAILKDFGKRTRQEDPVVHFYETFLSEYNPALRKSRGTYYTPEPVVSYITRSVDKLLRRDFDLEGLADETRIAGSEIHKVQILDPATGTGTFLHSIIDIIYESFTDNKGMWSGYVSEHLIPRLFAFELMMAPYTVAHMKMGIQLAETGYELTKNQRLGIYLTNALERGFGSKAQQLPFTRWLADEADAAGTIKHDAPVMVIVGNPPYAGKSENNGEWIKQLLHGKELLGHKEADGFKKTSNYFEVDGKPLQERNPKWLNDDYVKFIRFAQWRITQTGYGILAFITNHGYLDNPTFRGMRQSLIQTFDDIYILDLHGNSKKKQHSPDKSKDENVFDIQQGVAIGIFVKRQQKASMSPIANIYHAHLWGLREVYEKAGAEQKLIGGKYYWLVENDVTTTEWTKLEPNSPNYLFKPRDINLQKEYEIAINLIEIFGTSTPKVDAGKKYGLGICTHNDLLHVGFTNSEVFNRVQMLADKTLSDEIVLRTLPIKESPYWNTLRERGKVRKSNWKEKILPVYYRPFDWRVIYYEPDLMEIGRGGGSRYVMHHAKECSRNLMVSRGYEVDKFEHVLVANTIAVHHAATRKEGNYLFPLYLHLESQSGTLFDGDKASANSGGRYPNLSSVFISLISTRLSIQFVPDGKGDLQQTFGPEDIFNYIYAIFHSPAYRERYAEFLKIDFPRLPLTSSLDLFRQLCILGDRLVELHLMEKVGKITTKYPVDGNHVIEKIDYTYPADAPENSRVSINKTQYFEGVQPEIWDFHIGGYQVCQKWLKDRKGRKLSFDDIKHYQRIVAVLTETIILMEQIDDTIDAYGGWPVE